MSPLEVWKNKHSSQRKPQGQKPCGGTVLGVFGAQPPGEQAGVSEAEGGRRQSKRKSALVLLPRGLNRTTDLHRKIHFIAPDWASSPKLPSMDVFGHERVLECVCIRQTPSKRK